MTWSGTWSGTRRPSGRPWRRTRAEVHARANGRCQHIDPATNTRCHHIGRLEHDGFEVHHIGDPDDDRIENLAWLCGPHHDAITKAQAAAARRARPTMRRPPQRHPGLR